MPSQVLHLSFFSPSLRMDKKYCIYLPPSYDEEPGRRYSAVYLLPGLMDYECTWSDKGRVHEHMGNLIAKKKIGEMIIIMPDKEYLAAIEPDLADSFTSYLGRDLIGHIDCEFRTIAHRSHRGIEGLSLGATWALRMALNFPELYSSVGCLSGCYNLETYNKVLEKKECLQKLGMRFRVGIGSAEPDFIENSREFAHFLRNLGFYCEFSLDNGPHEWPLWREQIYNSLQFHYYTFNPV